MAKKFFTILVLVSGLLLQGARPVGATPDIAVVIPPVIPAVQLLQESVGEPAGDNSRPLVPAQVIIDIPATSVNVPPLNAKVTSQSAIPTRWGVFDVFKQAPLAFGLLAVRGAVYLGAPWVMPVLMPLAEPVAQIKMAAMVMQLADYGAYLGYLYDLTKAANGVVKHLYQGTDRVISLPLFGLGAMTYDLCLHLGVLDTILAHAGPLGRGVAAAHQVISSVPVLSAVWRSGLWRVQHALENRHVIAGLCDTVRAYYQLRGW